MIWVLSFFYSVLHIAILYITYVFLKQIRGSTFYLYGKPNTPNNGKISLCSLKISHILFQENY
jgi:hypothetical protein